MIKGKITRAECHHHHYRKNESNNITSIFFRKENTRKKTHNTYIVLIFFKPSNVPFVNVSILLPNNDNKFKLVSD